MINALKQLKTWVILAVTALTFGILITKLYKAYHPAGVNLSQAVQVCFSDNPKMTNELCMATSPSGGALPIRSGSKYLTIQAIQR